MAVSRVQRGSTLGAVSACLALTLTAARADAQEGGVDPRSTAIYLRAGAAFSGFNLDAMTFRAQGRPRDIPDAFSGKAVLLGREWLPGVSVGVHVDGPWFYVRVGADLYQNPSITASDYEIHSTTMGWIAAGPRVRLGPVMLTAGLRLGALLLDTARRDSDSSTSRDRSQQYSGLGALYAVDAGVQWRPLRWLELDATVGQDVLGPTLGTTFSLNASVGWSRAPRR